MGKPTSNNLLATGFIKSPPDNVGSIGIRDADKGPTMHVAFAGPMNVSKLADELDLREMSGNHPPPEPDGGHSVTDIILGMASRVDQLDLVTLDPKTTKPLEFRGERIRLAVGPYRPRIRTLSKDLFRVERRYISDKLREWQPDVAGGHWTYEYALGLLDSGVPHLITVRDWAPTILWSMRDRYRAVRLLMQALTFARGTNFAAVSPYMARKVERVTRRPVALIPNAISDAWLDTGARPRAPRGFDVAAINHGFDRRKNVKRLLVDWPEVRLRVPGSRLHLVGRGFEAGGPAQIWSADRGLDEDVLFRGALPRTHLRELLASTAVFVHPSREESFGMVVLEAMASGVPVVGGVESGAVPWLLSEGAGLLVDVQREGSIAEGVTRLLNDPECWSATAERGRSRAKDFALDKVADLYLSHLLMIAGSSDFSP